MCEDLWAEEYLPKPLYDRDPIAELRAVGIDLVLNLSASPYQLGKTALRRNLLESVAKEAGVTVVYCNAIGGNDELIFDGHSIVELECH